MTRSDRDPFGERRRRPIERRYRLLGCTLRVRSDDPRLATLADTAFGALPGGRPSGPEFTLELRLADDDSRFGAHPPPPARMSAGAGWLCGIVDAANYALVHAHSRAGLVSISPGMLRHAYHVRYELVEFAALTLLARGAPLVPLHAACFGLPGAGVLLIGDTGAGKSTLCAAALASGWTFVSEDATFVAPHDLAAWGIASFLHLRADSLRFVGNPQLAAQVRASPTIRRRSGVRKFEVDLRASDCRLAPNGLPLRAVIVLRAGSTRASKPLRALAASTVRATLARTQPYASGLDTWPGFLQHVRPLPGFELHRTTPAAALAAIRALLESPR